MVGLLMGFLFFACIFKFSQRDDIYLCVGVHIVDEPKLQGGADLFLSDRQL